MSPLLDVPGEVLLLIMTSLDVPGVLILRQTCRTVSQWTHDKSIWLHFLQSFRNAGNIPLPANHDSAGSAADLPSSMLESFVIYAIRASDSWLLPRVRQPIQTPLSGEALDGLNIFLDTWLLIVYVNGLVYLRSLQENAPQSHCATLDLSGTGKRWRSHSASLAPGHSQIILAMSNNSPPFETVVYEINLDVPSIAFNLVGTFTGQETRTIRALDVASRLVVLSSAARTLDVVSWDTETRGASKMLLNDDDTDSWYDGVISLRLLGSHFLAIRTHTIELHACEYATQSDRSMRPLKHRLPFPLREGSVSVSDTINASAPEPGGRRMRINLLAYDAHSIASYAIDISLPEAISANIEPAMDVTLTGEQRPAPPEVRNHNSAIRSHWFVSALTLGPQAIRAMWIERHSLTMTRHVRLCTLNRNEMWHDREMKTATSVFTLQSYDLRDDLTHCALAEISGQIVVGNRVGDVFLLTQSRIEQLIPRLNIQMITNNA